ncbi:universal stress protein [Alkaliphilus sp. MSJ-5]|uniref:Universal stress protein n=1 Tax=Alkaliphilus flagellatus TaxID=2841507 RepID=A0ABS6FYD3_9FIRM|nr:universal stress protein [Alkaliphilus flagellatus]MBU5675247.1 universal stress protein [Alkaliphilus flagellatus]
MNNENNIMVCVTKQKTCEKLIQSGVKIKEQIGGDLFVVHVAPTGWNFLGNSQEGEALDYLFEISKAVGADMTVLRSSEVVKTIVDFCEKNSITIIVLGESPEVSEDNNIISKLTKKLGQNIEIKVVSTY